MNRVVRVGILLAMTLLWSVPGAPARAGGGCHGVSLTDVATTTVRTQAACFVPTVARVSPGDAVTFVSGDGVEHNVTGVPAPFNALQKEQALRSGTDLAFRFREAGVYPYVCTLHPMMAGAIVVADGGPAGRDAAVLASNAEGGGGTLTPWQPAAALAAAIVAAAVLAAVTHAAARRRRAQPLS
ncbi:MAG: hypothetical protein GEU74_04875 [Nitriliruptorales bacterium]|nr:hypothetical protein [Nitriliruptorales bacterium]